MDRLKLPLMSVMVPITLPFTMMFTPIKGSPVASSVTFPETEVWAISEMLIPEIANSARPNASRVKVFFIVLSLDAINNSSIECCEICQKQT